MTNDTDTARFALIVRQLTAAPAPLLTTPPGRVIAHPTDTDTDDDEGVRDLEAAGLWRALAAEQDCADLRTPSNGRSFAPVASNEGLTP